MERHPHAGLFRSGQHALDEISVIIPHLLGADHRTTFGVKRHDFLPSEACGEERAPSIGSCLGFYDSHVELGAAGAAATRCKTFGAPDRVREEVEAKDRDACTS